MKSTLVKVLVVVLALAMVLPMVVACKKDDNGGNTTTTAGAGSNPTSPDNTNPVPTVKPWDDGKTYTYRMGPSSLPTTWNVHTYQSNDATYILDYTSDALYGFEYNKDFTGYEIVPAMASAFPTDVTSQFIGHYGIVEGDKNKAWQIPLKDGLTFDNGEKLDAKSFVDSMKLLLDPRASNFRADNVYASGNLKIVGAEDYVKQGSYAYSEFVSAAYGDDEYVDPAKFTTTDDGYLQYNGKDVVLNLSDGGNWGSNGLDDYNGAGYLVAVADAFAKLDAAADDDRCVKLNAELLKAAQDCIAVLHGYASADEYAAATKDTKDGVNYAYVEVEEMLVLGGTWPVVAYEDTVGFFQGEGNSIVVVLKNAMEDNFYLRYELCTNFFLVYAPLYESLINVTEDGVYTNSYGTSVDTFVGFGPYKLTSYIDGSAITLERNTGWRGYSDADYIPGTYQTDAVSYKQVDDEATRLEMFLAGQLDSYGLQADDMETYGSSDYTYYTDSESTWYLVMNPDMDNLVELQKAATPATAGNTVIKTVLTIQEFRQALSYSINRQNYNQTLSPTSGIAKALLSSMIVADPESGLTYRSLDQAKDAILKFWGLADQWGEGKKYADRDAAIDSITGYDPDGAKALFNTAYDKAVAQGLISEDLVASGKWEVQITIGIPKAVKYYNDGSEVLKGFWTEAAKGTKFEGHITCTNSQELGSSGFGEYLRTGQVDLLFGVGYGGSMFDPYSMMDCFTGSLQYDPFTDKAAIECDVYFDPSYVKDEKLAGKTLRASLYDWVSEACMGNEITAVVVDKDGNATKESVTLSAGTSDAPETRITILAAAEGKILTLANVFPLSTDATASLRCMRVKYKTEDYVVGMGRGGIEWYTYAMDDTEFAEYVNSQGGKLDYT